MTTRRSSWLVLAALLVLALGPAARADECGEDEFTREFRLEDCTFRPNGGNPYFSLEPGNVLVLEGEEDGEELMVEVRVLNEQRTIVFDTPAGHTLKVKTRVVQESEWVDGELVEVSRNFFSRCKETGDIYYFGEEVDDYEDGEIVGHGGAWIAGVDDALPGVIMPGSFLLGARYFQEVAPGVALDRGENVALGLTVEVPAGTFEGCVEVLDSNALHCDNEGDTKVYCPGIGLVIDEVVELVEYGTNGHAGVTNGDFNAGKSAWSFYTSGSGSFEVVRGEAEIFLADPGGNAQLFQNSVMLEGNTTYRLSFTGHSSRGQNLQVFARMHADPFTGYGLAKTVDLGTTPAEHEVIFTTTPGAKADARLQFYFTPFDQPGDAYWLDHIELEPVEATARR